jgi:hypothetical protein
MRAIAVGLALLLLLCGCARMVVKKAPGDHDKGIRFYRPKPYLFVGPGEPPKPNNQDGYSARIAGVPVVMRIEYLPDYSDEYSIRMTPGLGTTDLTVALDKGWNLTSVNAKTDQKYAEIIESVAKLASAFTGAPGAGGARTYGGGQGEWSGSADFDVPLGYYEAVIGIDECGKKSLVGWRYVGFMALGCPGGIVCTTRFAQCGPPMYAIVADGPMLRMRRLDRVETTPVRMVAPQPTTTQPPTEYVLPNAAGASNWQPNRRPARSVAANRDN